MDTKICRGILHPEGVELPLDKFEKHSRYAYRKKCKKCRSYENNLSQQNRGYPAATKFRHENFRQYKNTQDKYKHSEKGKKRMSISQRRTRAKLSSSYVRTQLSKILLIERQEVPGEYIELKRKLLILYRVTKIVKDGKNN